MSQFPPIVFAIAFGSLVIALTALARRLPPPAPLLRPGRIDSLGLATSFLLLALPVHEC